MSQEVNALTYICAESVMVYISLCLSIALFSSKQTTDKCEVYEKQRNLEIHPR